MAERSYELSCLTGCVNWSDVPVQKSDLRMRNDIVWNELNHWYTVLVSIILYILFFFWSLVWIELCGYVNTFSHTNG